MDAARFDPAWRIDDLQWPGHGSPRARWTFLIQHAVLAPSSHNAQPWRFRLEGDTLELLADRARAQPVSDPYDRELVISCGAALGTMEIAARAHGVALEIATVRQARSRDLLACVRFGAAAAAADVQAARRLYAAIPLRHTNRHPFDPTPIRDPDLDALRAQAARFGIEARFLVDDGDKRLIADLVAEGDRMLGRRPEFRRELADRLHPNRRTARDGVPGYAQGLGAIASAVGPLVARNFDWGPLKAAKDRELALASAALVVLIAPADTPTLWLATGRALAHLLLEATALGLASSFLNQAIELLSLRLRLEEALALQGKPQLLIRLGRALRQTPPTPRRSIDEVIESR
ncbi:MAG: nitroreductase family protein [Burkholderiaceae bacterium]